MICMCALSKLADVCHRVISGDILVHELKTIFHKESQLSKLCDAATGPSKRKDSGKKSSLAEYVPPYDRVKVYLDIRQKELDYFMKYQDQLKRFLHLCKPVVLSGKVFGLYMFQKCCSCLCRRLPYLTLMPIQICAT